MRLIRFVLNEESMLIFDFRPLQGVPNDSWKISKINESYTFCDTYPGIVSFTHNTCNLC